MQVESEQIIPLKRSDSEIINDPFIQGLQSLKKNKLLQESKSTFEQHLERFHEHCPEGDF